MVHIVKFVDGRLEGAVVSKSALARETWGALQAIVEFTNDARQIAQFTDQELLPEVIGIYCADYYLAQVNNGGHSQFVGNSGKSLVANVNFALPALKMIGANDQYRTLAELKAWVVANPKVAAAQDGFDNRAALLDDLDTRFDEAEKHASITDLSAHWIKAWSKLEVVDDLKYRERLKALGALNPHFDIRRASRAIEQNRHNLSSPLEITTALLCGAVTPEPDAKIWITAGIPHTHEGQSVIAWGVLTDKSMRGKSARIAVLLQGGGVLMDELGGRRIASVSAGEVRNFVEAAERSHAAAAIDLIMLQAGYETTDVGHPSLTAWKREGDETTIIARLLERNLVIRCGSDGATLLDAGLAPILTVSADEVTSHSDKALRGSKSLEPVAS